MKKIWGDPPIVVTVSRQDVDSNNVQPTLDSLRSLLQDPAQIRANLGRLVLSFEGFGKKTGAIWFDEVWQVPQGRSFVGKLDEEFPYWFFFGDLSGDTVYTVAACVCRIEVRGPLTIFNKEDFLALDVRQFEAMNELFRKWSWTEEEYSARVEQLIQYFKGVPVE
jgi:hypothetical protein